MATLIRDPILCRELAAGARTRAAERLGVSVRTIRNKLHQYGLSEAV